MTAKAGSHPYPYFISMYKNLNKQQLRKKLKILRRNASKSFAEQASSSLAKQLNKLRVYRSSQNIALYLPFYSEFPTASILKRNSQLKKNSFVPRISSFNHHKMQFVEFNTNTGNLKKNILGIEEPQEHSTKLHTINANALDIIFMPLLGFDTQGRRLGMGGGYYDRALAFKRSLKSIKKPYLIGLAYEAQRLEEIKSEPWDVPLDAIITEQNCYVVDSALL